MLIFRKKHKKQRSNSFKVVLPRFDFNPLFTRAKIRLVSTKPTLLTFFHHLHVNCVLGVYEYKMGLIEELEDNDAGNCPVCNKVAQNKCTGCNAGIFYCTRECQKKHWKTHKFDCKSLPYKVFWDCVHWIKYVLHKIFNQRTYLRKIHF